MMFARLFDFLLWSPAHYCIDDVFARICRGAPSTTSVFLVSDCSLDGIQLMPLHIHFRIPPMALRSMGTSVVYFLRDLISHLVDFISSFVIWRDAFFDDARM